MSTEPIAVSVRTAADMLDVSQDTIRAAINRGELTARRVGRILRIGTADLRQWFDSHEAA